MSELKLSQNWRLNASEHQQTVIAREGTTEERRWDDAGPQISPDPHYMQSSAWGVSKAHSAWMVSRLSLNDETSITLPIQVFSRTVPGLGRLHYAPQASGVTIASLSNLTQQLKNHYGKGLVFKLELYQPYSELLVEAFLRHGWKIAHSIQYRHTVLVDLSGPEEELFNSLKKRARYEIRYAQRNGVRIEKVDMVQKKLDLLSTLMDITAKRSGAFFRSREYTNKYWHAFAQSNQGSLYFAWHDRDLLAGAFIVRYGKRAWYKDGGSVRQKPNLMAPRLLQWEIMRDLQRQGVQTYDLAGIPAPTERETSPIKGLYTFKSGFSRDLTRLMPTLELPLGKQYRIWPKSECQFLRLYAGLRKDFWY